MAAPFHTQSDALVASGVFMLRHFRIGHFHRQTTNWYQLILECSRGQVAAAAYGNQASVSLV